MIIDGLEILSSFKREINPVIYDLNGTLIEDYNPIYPTETTQVLAMQQQLTNSGKRIKQTLTWITPTQLNLGTKVKYADDQFEIVDSSDYQTNGYSNVTAYQLSQLDSDPDATDVGGGSKWQ